MPLPPYYFYLEQCQDFINKVSELRFNKVKQRQINKLNHLVTKKEGNITHNITLNRLAQRPPNPHIPTPATALLPPREGNNSPPATVHPPPEANSSLNNLASNSNTTNNSVNTNSSLNLVNQVSNQTISQVPPHNQTPAIAHLPPGEGSNSPPVAVQLPPEAISSPPQTRSTTAREENNSSQANSPPVTNIPQYHRASQAGHSVNPPRASRQGTRQPPGTNPLNLPLRLAQPPGKVPPPPHPPAGPARVLLMKNPTLSGSLTFPTNL